MTTWKIDVPGVIAFRTDDLTLDEAVAVEDLTGYSWTALNPVRSAKDCRAVMKVVLLRDHSAEQADAVLATIKAVHAYDCTNVADDDMPDSYGDGGIPNPEGAASTPTS